MLQDLLDHVGLRRFDATCSPDPLGGMCWVVGAANPRKAFFQIATFEKGSHAPDHRRPGCPGGARHRSPEAVLGLKSFVIDLAEGLKMLIHQAPQVGSTRTRVGDTGATVWGRQEP